MTRHTLGIRLRALWRALRRSSELEREMRDEMLFHIEMEAERLARQGVDPLDARRQACARFGGVEKYREAGRAVRGLGWIDAVSLDTRLGVRMLAKYRGLTFVGGFAMAVAMAIGATAFETLGEVLAPALPFDPTGRIVALENTAAAPADVAAWRGQLGSVGDLGAFRTVPHNLVSPLAPPEPVKVAEMSASGFAIAGVQAFSGRHLLPSDEQPGAPPALVLGYQAWRTRFAADPGIVGRRITLGAVPHTVVGIMPDGFGFPFDHQFWIPLPVTPRAAASAGEPRLSVFGRLADGITIEQAQAELTTVARRLALDRSGEQGPPQAAVVPYTRAHVDLSSPGLVWLLRIVQVLCGALAFVVAVNLAILFYARTVTRLGEIAVRTALGASRRRILVQLFIEALVLSLVGTAGGLGLSAIALEYIQVLARANGGVPFWIRFELTFSTVAASLALASFAALIMGVVPGLKATGRAVSAQLHELKGHSGARLGAMWTTMVVVQVGAAVAVLPAALYLAWQVARMEVGGVGFDDRKFAITLVALPDASLQPHRLAARQLELMSRLRAEPNVEAVTFSSFVPGLAGGARIEFAPRTAVTAPAPWHVSRLDVALDMLDVFGAEIVAGRGFVGADVGAAHAAIVNQTFARWLAGDGLALGIRFRYVERAGRAITDGAWHEIVGVVRDFPRFPSPLNVDTPAVVFHPAAVGTVDPAVLTVRFGGDVPAAFSVRVRQLAAEIDQALQVRRATSLASHYDQVRAIWRSTSWGLAVATVSVLLLSAAGIYALLSCTVAQRTREIGVRIALGARPGRLLASIFARVARPLALGFGAGSLLSGFAMWAAGVGIPATASLLLAVTGVMAAAGLFAAWGPARRMLGIDAAEALRTEN
jgi:predicted permease